MLTHPTRLGTRGTLNPPACRARQSSHTPTHTAAVASTTKVHFGMTKRVTTTAAPSPRPTATAAGRLRPARETLAESASEVTGATTALSDSAGGVTGASSVIGSDLRELALLALEQR